MEIAKGVPLSTKAHTVFTVSIIQKDSDNEDLPFPKSTIQFVDLAGSEKTSRNLAEGTFGV